MRWSAPNQTLLLGRKRQRPSTSRPIARGGYSPKDDEFERIARRRVQSHAGIREAEGMADDRHAGEQEITRRGFVGWAMGLGTGFVALVVGIPLVGSVLGASGRAAPGQFVKVADVSAIPVGEPFGLSFAEITNDAYNVAALPHSVYALKKSDTEVAVYSPICPHLGCQVYFDRQLKQYVCPCHGSRFSEDGAHVAGPAPRGLDTLPSRIKDGALWVQWVQYKPSLPEKTPV
jgi:menaquinol-cytochrome c reductase iron-sulfur subunit